MEKHYDIGLYGWWGHDNFGGCLTYFALHETLKNMGYSVLMIQEALGISNIRYKIKDTCIAMRFAKKHYDCSAQVDYKELPEFNDICDTFFVGGDQLWNNLIPFVSEDDFLNWVNDDKRKISYSTSFGSKNHNPPVELKEKYSELLQRYNAISVRENYAPDLSKKIYGVEATEIIDAVFLQDKEVYEKIAKEATVSFDKKYLLAFILNPIPEKRKVIEDIAEKLGIDEIICIPDAAVAYHKSMNEVFEGHNILKDLSIENFLYAYSNAAYIVTDSFHGTCMAAIFQKPFSVFYNAIRGVDRFISLQNLLELQNREIKKTYTKEDVFNNENISFDIDYSKTNENISKATKFAFEWLGSVLKMPVNKFVKFYKENSMLHIEEKKKMIEKKPPVKLSADGERCRIVVALMKKFGIKHIVISAGTRNITFNRLFEANQDFFKTYHVTDERSAGFFALGLATKLKEIVCICCTSGPSVCNYVPPVTEAFYQRVPLLILTTDRYPGMFECQDHQSVDQIKMLSAIVKKSFSLPAGNEIKPRITATTVSEALYEIENKWSGPVHLNVHIKPIDKLAVISNYLTLPDIKLRNRITPKNENLLSECVEYLKKKKKILVIINQQMPPNNKLKQLFIDFASKYNCVLYVDHFSNLRNNYTVFHGEEQLKDAALSPDLVINFGEERTNISPGLNLLNCSEYWRVNGDGKFTNKYFILSNVFECSDEFFLQYFSENAKENTNDKIYLNLLKENKKELFKYDFDKWEMKYTIGSLIKNMPENSLFHIARSLTVRHAHKFDKLPNGVEVYCNSGVNGIDGCASTFMGQAAVACDDELAFLCIGDLTFFYDINSLWNKDLKGNIRIMLNNNGGAGLLTYSKSDGAIHSHNAIAKGWVESLGFKYITANNKEEFDKLLPIFVAKESDKPIFFEIFTTRS